MKTLRFATVAGVSTSAVDVKIRKGRHEPPPVEESCRLERPRWHGQVVMEGKILDDAREQCIPPPFVASWTRGADEARLRVRRSIKVGDELADVAKALTVSLSLPKAGG